MVNFKTTTTTTTTTTATLLLLLLLRMAIILTHLPSSRGVNSSYGGSWKLLRRSVGVSAMHVAPLPPTDRFVVFDRTDFGPSNASLPAGRCRDDAQDQALAHDCTAHAVEFDPRSRAVRPLTVRTDTWCSSGALLPDGTLVQTGGFNDGDHVVRYLSSCDDCDWVEDRDGLSARRWYATNHILPDGRVIVVGGRGQFGYEFVPKAAAAPADRAVFALPFLRETRDAWENNLYPFVHLAPDGNLFVFANNKSILLDYARHKVLRNFPDMPGGASRNYPSSGSSVLLPLRLDGSSGSSVKAEVMVCGGAAPASFSMANGGAFAPASSSCGRLAITEESPEWEMDEMPVGRVMGDMVLLPTGDVLIINGAGRGTAGWGLGRDPALHPLLYKVGVDGSNESRGFEVLQPSTIPRLYHSTARLMLDGRVLVGGSNPNVRYVFARALYPTELSLEAFYPPYLGSRGSKVPRPKITRVKSQWKYGERVKIAFRMDKGDEEGGEAAVAVTMAAPAFTTHSFSMSQRVLVLAAAKAKAKANCSSASSGGFYAAEVFAPRSAALAPPGYYMLFVVHGGVPSRGKWVHVEQ